MENGEREREGKRKREGRWKGERERGKIEWESEKVRKWESEKVRKWESEKVRKWESEKVRKWESEKVRKWESEKVRKWESEKLRHPHSIFSLRGCVIVFPKLRKVFHWIPKILRRVWRILVNSKLGRILELKTWPRAQCYKAFSICNLRIFVISWSVCPCHPWHVFPA